MNASDAQDTHQTQTAAPLELQVTCQFCKYLLEDALLGDCRVRKWLGSGAFGDVYEAEQVPPLHRRVALKVMSIEHVTNGKAAELFEREVRSIAALDHPNILPVLRVGTIADGHPYFVMKFAAHGSLQKFLLPSQPPVSLLPTISMSHEEPVQEHEELSTVSTLISHDIEQEEQAQSDSDEKADRDDNGNDEDIRSVKVVASSESEAISSASQPHIVDDAVQEQQDEDAGEDHLAEATPSISGQATVVAETSFASNLLSEGMPDPGATVSLKPTESTALTPQQLLPYLEGTAVALQYAHDHDIIHLDVKPANLLLDSEDRVLLADFGVSAILEGYTHASLHGYVGTPLYTAPEQWKEQPRAASDQYALAITCYQLLTGHAPFSGNLYSIMHGHLQVQPSPLRTFQPGIPMAIEAVILRALAKDPRDRYENVQAFASAYRDALKCPAHEDQRDMPANIEAVPTLEFASQTTFPDDVQQHPVDEGDVRTLNRSVAVADHPVSRMELALPGEKVRPRPRHRVRNTLLGLVALLLVLSGTLGIMRVASPCLLGICSSMSLSTDKVTMLNDATQYVTIRNIGSDTLNWHASISNTGTWLTISPTRGTLAPGASTRIMLGSNTNGMPDGTNDTFVRITGSGVTQDIEVTLQVQTGLQAVQVKPDGTDFSLTQGVLQPATRKVTITNNSGKTLTWNAAFEDSNWLVVTPDHGTLTTGKSVNLSVTVNTEKFSSNTYIASTTRLILLGQLEGQTGQSPLSSVTYSLSVTQLPPTPTPGTRPTSTPTVQPSFSLSYNTQSVPLSSTAPTTQRSGHSMIWDDHDNIALLFGGIDNHGTLLNDLWTYNPATNAWNQLSPPSVPADCNAVPAPRMNAAMVWDSADQKLLLYGGIGANNTYLGDLWEYDFVKGNWTALQCTGNAPGARVSSAAWDGQEMLLLGGMNGSGGLSDFWSYNLNTGWHKLPSTPMKAQAYQTLVWDPVDSSLLVFGGVDASSVQQGDLWKYSTSTGWTFITAQSSSTSIPMGRQQAVGVWDSRHNVMLIMGGWEDSQKIPFWSVWAYDPHLNAWDLLTPLDSRGAHIIPGRTAAGMFWDTANNTAYIYAGAGNDKTTSSLDDLWALS